MKKFLLAMAMILGVVFSQFFSVPQAEAAEVYAATENSSRRGMYDIYVVTESLQNTSYGFIVRVHLIGKDNSFSNNGWYAFAYNDIMGWRYGIFVQKSLITPDMISNSVSMSKSAQGILNVANQYR